ncbi:hypothetical protein EYF80_050859 [Liparis tanakae]|uniref:Uncharacterized protein n=1 Tax=Liparis tanakae TaxID=230148 RepID=A0A4Z2FDX5_9TELE|nr:hypothetical protein EYF80_050859 [Liparis tanakae]
MRPTVGDLCNAAAAACGRPAARLVRASGSTAAYCSQCAVRSGSRSPSTLLDGCSFSTLMQPFICRAQHEGSPILFSLCAPFTFIFFFSFDTQPTQFNPQRSNDDPSDVLL